MVSGYVLIITRMPKTGTPRRHTSNKLNRVGSLDELIQLCLGDHEQRVAFALGMDDTVAKQIAVTESDNLFVSESENFRHLLAGIRSLHVGEYFGLTFGELTHVFIPPSTITAQDHMIFYTVGNLITRSQLLPMPSDAPVLSIRRIGKGKRAGGTPPAQERLSVLRAAFTSSPSHETRQR